MVDRKGIAAQSIGLELIAMWPVAGVIGWLLPIFIDVMTDNTLLAD